MLRPYFFGVLTRKWVQSPQHKYHPNAKNKDSDKPKFVPVTGLPTHKPLPKENRSPTGYRPELGPGYSNLPKPRDSPVDGVFGNVGSEF